MMWQTMLKPDSKLCKNIIFIIIIKNNFKINKIFSAVVDLEFLLFIYDAQLKKRANMFFEIIFFTLMNIYSLLL